MNILIVDDEALARSRLRTLLGDCGPEYHVQEAAHAADALAVLQQRVGADIDLVLLDIKAFSEATYHAVTGAELQPTLDFAQRLARLGKPVWLRYVLVPGLTDKADEIDGLAAYAKALGNVSRVDVLPFHKMGEFKWEDCGRPYQLGDTEPPTPALVEATRGRFRAAGLNAP